MQLRLTGKLSYRSIEENQLCMKITKGKIREQGPENMAIAIALIDSNEFRTRKLQRKQILPPWVLLVIQAFNHSSSHVLDEGSICSHFTLSGYTSSL